MLLPKAAGSRTILLLLISQTAFAQGDDGWRTVEIQTSEVSAPDMAIAPNGEWLVFNLLGHLFRLPVEGGEAKQLTFGPFYDARPAVSPDGRRVAFQSDRDGSDGNIFLLDLLTGAVTQLTEDTWADAPFWSPDGQSLVYLRRGRERWNSPATVWRIGIRGGVPEELWAEAGNVHSPFSLRDGRVGWAVTGQDTVSGKPTTRIEVMAEDGSVSTMRTLAGPAGAVVPTEDGFVVRRQTTLDAELMTTTA